MQTIPVGTSAVLDIGPDFFPYEVIKCSKTGKKLVLRETSGETMTTTKQGGSIRKSYKSKPEGDQIVARYLEKEHRFVACGSKPLFLGSTRVYRRPN